MKPYAALFVLLFFCCTSSFSQALLITCSSEQNQDKSISIYCDSRAYGEYTVKLTFTLLEGYTSPLLFSNIALAPAEQGRREICRLSQNKSAFSYSYQYRYQYFPGKALRQLPDSGFAYLLPAAAGSSVRISKVTAVSEELGQGNPNDFRGTGFVYKQGDTICAARAGIVYNCNDAVKEGEKASDFYKSTRNQISVQHKDGSLCTYHILAPIKLLVEAGDNVYPGQPLAVFNTQSEKYMVLFSTFYLDEKKLLVTNNDAGKPAPSCFIYTGTHFHTAGSNKSTTLLLNNSYAVEHPKEIIVSELSKKEKKKLGL